MTRQPWCPPPGSCRRTERSDTRGEGAVADLPSFPRFADLFLPTRIPLAGAVAGRRRGRLRQHARSNTAHCRCVAPRVGEERPSRGRDGAADPPRIELQRARKLITAAEAVRKFPFAGLSAAILNGDAGVSRRTVEDHLEGREDCLLAEFEQGLALAAERATAAFQALSLIHISEPTRLGMTSYAV